MKSAVGHDDVTALLPHRFPFQFVDRVLEFEDGTRIVTLKNVSINEPFFRGHFPEHPLMPGVLICEALAQAAALLAYRSHNGIPTSRVGVLSGLDKVRFRRPVFPGDQLHLEVRSIRHRRPLWKMHGIARVGGHVAAEADLSLMETTRARRP